MKNFNISRKNITSLLGFFALSIVFFATTLNCSKSEAPQATLESKTLRLAIWANYISPDVIKAFEQESGVKVEMSTYSSNEELYAKLKAGGSLYDVIVPSDYMVEILIKEGLLETLSPKLVELKTQLVPAYMDKDFDKGNLFTLPYAWTTTGIAYNTDLTKDKPTSWSSLLNNNNLKSKISMLDDGREVISTALKATGKSINTTDTKDLEGAKTLLKAFRSRVKLFTSEPYLALSNKEVAVAQIYSSDALQLKKEGKLNIEFIIPEEGSPLAIDNFALVKGAPNKTNAEKFIAFVLSPKNYKINFENQMFGPVVKDLGNFIDEKLKKDPVLFPSAERISKLEQMKDLGDKTELYDRLWTEFKAE